MKPRNTPILPDSLDAEPPTGGDSPTWFRAGVTREAPARVDAAAHIIYGVALNTEGPAKGHRVSLDAEFVDGVVALGQAQPNGLKSRFGHPAMCGTDALGTYLGRLKNVRRDTNAAGLAVARADLHFADSAALAPNGDLRAYIEQLASESPDQFGMSIVFQPGERYRRDAKGDKQYRYKSNGAKNEAYDAAAQPDFVEIKALHAADVVDTPAANESGLFSAFTDHLPAAQVTAFLDANPQVWDLLQDPAISRQFFERYEAHVAERKPLSENAKTNPQPPTKGTRTMSFVATMLAAFGYKPKDGEDENTQLAAALAGHKANLDAALLAKAAADTQLATATADLASARKELATALAAQTAAETELATAKATIALRDKAIKLAKDHPVVKPPNTRSAVSDADAPADEHEAEYASDPDLQEQFTSAQAYAAYARRAAREGARK